VHSDSPVLTLLDAGKDMVSDVSEELKDLARFRLRSLAESRLAELLTRPEPPDKVWRVSSTDARCLTHGLWLVCSHEDSSHHGFANYLMSFQWWSCVGHPFACSFASRVADVLADGRDAAQSRLAGRNTGDDLLDLFNAAVNTHIPDHTDTLKRWLLEMNTWERRVYGPTYRFRRGGRPPRSRRRFRGVVEADAAKRPDWGFRTALTLWAGTHWSAGGGEASQETRAALKAVGLTYKEPTIPEWRLTVNAARLEEFILATRTPLDDETLLEEQDSSGQGYGGFITSVHRHDAVDAFREELELHPRSPLPLRFRTPPLLPGLPLLLSTQGSPFRPFPHFVSLFHTHNTHHSVLTPRQCTHLHPIPFQQLLTLTSFIPPTP